MRKVFSILMVSFVLVGFISCGKSKSPLAGRTYGEILNGHKYSAIIFDETEFLIRQDLWQDYYSKDKYVMKKGKIYYYNRNTGKRGMILGEYDEKTDTVHWNNDPLRNKVLPRLEDGACGKITDERWPIN